MRLVPLKDDGTPDIDSLNAEFTADYLADKRNPRWVAKPTVAYLWARTVTCKNCRATVPLLKTRWLCKKPNKRVLLTMEPKRRSHRRRVRRSIERSRQGRQRGTKTRTRQADWRRHDVAMPVRKCPCCSDNHDTMEDIRVEGKAGRLGAILTAVVVDDSGWQEHTDFRPTESDVQCQTAAQTLRHVFAEIPFGLPAEPIPECRMRWVIACYR